MDAPELNADELGFLSEALEVSCLKRSRNAVTAASAYAPGVRLVVGDRSAKQIGCVLRRAEGRVIAGYAVQRMDVAVNNVLVWRVVATP